MGPLPGVIAGEVGGGEFWAWAVAANTQAESRQAVRNRVGMGVPPGKGRAFVKGLGYRGG